MMENSSLQVVVSLEDLNEMQRQIDEMVNNIQSMQLDLDIDLQDRICGICTQEKNLSTFKPISCFEHTFCLACAAALVSNAIREFKVIKCPFENCGAEFNESSPFFDELDSSSKQKYLKVLRNKKILQNPNLSLCSKPQCEGNMDINLKKIECNICKQQYCYRCLQFSHDGKCDRLVAKIFQRKYKFRTCPQCRMIVQKNQGCDHITCLCTHQFCYICGQSYLYGEHFCVKPPHLKGFSSFRWSIERQSTENFNIINLSKILYYLEPDIEHSGLYRFIYTLLFTVFVYPVLNALVIGLILLIAIVYLGLSATAIVLYFILLPLAEVRNMQLAPAIWMQNHDVHRYIIRISMLPMYPINFFFGIFQKAKVINLSSEIPRAKGFLRVIGFFLSLPFLMNVDAE